MFSLELHHFPTWSTLWYKVRIAEKEGDLLIFNIDVLKYFLPIAKITTQPTGKIDLLYTHHGRVKGTALCQEKIGSDVITSICFYQGTLYSHVCCIVMELLIFTISVLFVNLICTFHFMMFRFSKVLYCKSS